MSETAKFKCKKCNSDRRPDEFYASSLSVCKHCIKKRAKERTREKLGLPSDAVLCQIPVEEDLIKRGEMDAARQERSGQIERVRSGLCCTCGKPSNGSVVCEDCKARQRLRRHSCLIQGLCIKCCVCPAEPNRTACAACLEAMRNTSKSIRDKRIKEGLCVCCGHKKQNNEKKTCVDCRLKDIAKKANQKLMHLLVCS